METAQNWSLVKYLTKSLTDSKPLLKNLTLPIGTLLMGFYLG